MDGVSGYRNPEANVNFTIGKNRFIKYVETDVGRFPIKSRSGLDNAINATKSVSKEQWVQILQRELNKKYSPGQKKILENKIEQIKREVKSEPKKTMTSVAPGRGNSEPARDVKPVDDGVNQEMLQMPSEESTKRMQILDTTPHPEILQTASAKSKKDDPPKGLEAAFARAVEKLEKSEPKKTTTPVIPAPGNSVPAPDVKPNPPMLSEQAKKFVSQTISIFGDRIDYDEKKFDWGVDYREAINSSGIFRNINHISETKREYTDFYFMMKDAFELLSNPNWIDEKYAAERYSLVDQMARFMDVAINLKLTDKDLPQIDAIMHESRLLHPRDIEATFATAVEKLEKLHQDRLGVEHFESTKSEENSLASRIPLELFNVVKQYNRKIN
jgi:hypothetical protein